MKDEKLKIKQLNINNLKTFKDYDYIIVIGR